MEARVAAIHAGEASERVWLLEHPPLYTAGVSARDEDLIDAVGIDREELIVHVHQGRDLGVFAHNEWPRGDAHPEEGA